ncbi:sulfite exporter TauE/SafE family protein [Novosphingobium sp.]|uniref:sulfite exporter TauE/SafE family protein n=1 Tax=Novosphingobium sp. TaxID=1874826 RepID=UPI003B519282
MLAHFDLAQIDALHVFAGLLVGFLVGLTGVGGGSLMTPVLVLLFGVSPTTAVGTDLLFASTTKIVGSAIHGTRHSVDWSIVRRMAMGSVPAAIVTLVLMSQFGHPPRAANHTLMVVLGAMLVLTAIATLFQKRLAAFARAGVPEPVEGEPAPSAPGRTILLGAVLGVAVTMSSVGAGAIGVTALLMLYPALRVARIVGSDIAHAVPLTMIAGFGHWVIGDVSLVLLVNLLIGSLPGVVVGSLLSTRSPDYVLRPVLAAVLLFSGYKLITG